MDRGLTEPDYHLCMTHISRRQANLLGSLSLAVSDRIRSACVEEAQNGGEAPAGLVAIATFLSGGSIEELSRALALSHSATVRIVDKLETQGLVRRQGGADRRAVALMATERGRKRSDRILAARESVLAGLLDPLSEADRTQLTRLHESLLAMLVDDGAAPTQICRLCDPDGCGHETGDCPVTEAGRARL